MPHSSSPLKRSITTSERNRWVQDPRPDLGDDSAAWTALLAIAFGADSVDPTGAFGSLHGLRCCGAGLERDERGRWRLLAGAMDTAEYEVDREVWLMPLRREGGEWLGRLEVSTPARGNEVWP